MKLSGHIYTPASRERPSPFVAIAAERLARRSSSPPANPGQTKKEASMAGRRKAREPEQTSSEVSQPNLKALRSLFLNDVKPATEKGASSRGDLAAAWKTAENDLHCSKPAAKLLYKLMNMSEELRDDFLRTLLPGLQEMNLLPAEDLVDLMDEITPGIVAGAKKPMGTEGMPALQ